MSADFNRLVVKDKIVETDDAVSIVFEIPEALRAAYQFRSGQYISIENEIKGKKIRRSYSISSAPKEDLLRITIKAVKGGRMSTYLVNQFPVGDTLSVSTPEGTFTAEWQEHMVRRHYFICAGSGISPVMSLLKDGLENEPKSTFILLYGSRTPESIIFRRELENLEKHYEGQLFVIHTLSKTGRSAGGLSSIFRKKQRTELWIGARGRISREKLDQVFHDHPVLDQRSHFYLCGPGDMIKSMNAFLSDRSIDKKYIHKEYFTNPDEDQGSKATNISARLFARNLHGQDITIEVKAGKTLLESLQDANQDPPYSCINGVCSSCMAKLTKGQVKMDSCLALDDDELAEGYILPCQAHPLTEELEIVYTD